MTVSRSGRPWRRLRAQVAREESHCWLCLKLIDYRLKSGPWCYELDHIVPVKHGGRDVRSNVHASHLRCNRKRGAKPRTESAGLPRSRDW